MRRREFDAVYASQCSAADERLIVYIRANGLAFSRIGRSVAAKWGKANARNHFRRLVFEAFRLNKDRLPTGCDIIVIPRRTIELSLEEIAESLVALCGKLCNSK